MAKRSLISTPLTSGTATQIDVWPDKAQADGHGVPLQACELWFVHRVLPLLLLDASVSVKCFSCVSIACVMCKVEMIC